MDFRDLTRTIASGNAAILMAGRSLFDYDVDNEREIRPLISILRRTLREELGIALLTYSPATGLIWSTPDLREHGGYRDAATALQSMGVIDPDNVADPDPGVFMRNMWDFLRVRHTARWSDTRRMSFALLVLFGADVFPPAETGRLAEQELCAIEWGHLLGTSRALAKSGNAFLVHAHDAGAVHVQIRSVLQTYRLRYPDRASKRIFIQAGLQAFPKAAFVEGLAVDQAAYLTSNTPNWSLERMLRRSHAEQVPIEAGELIRRRAEDVEAVSEGLLTSMEGQDLELVGRTVAHPWEILHQIATQLRNGDPRTPHNILLAGAPGTGKTAMAIRLARESQVNAYRIQSPKSRYVGATERRARMLFEILNEWAPNIGFVDEITEMMTTERPEHDLDAGTSRAVIGALLSYLGDENRRGRTIFLGATNCPWRMAEALRSRFVVIPVLLPIERDYPGIVACLLRRAIGTAVDPETDKVREAAKIFYDKHATPRHILEAIHDALLIHGTLAPADLALRAAEDFCAETGWQSAIYSDLWAVRLTTSKAFFPWYRDPEYPIPPYLQRIVDPATGDIDRNQLMARIQEHSRYARV